MVVVVIAIGSGARQMLSPFTAAAMPEISLSPLALPVYALRTTIRMLAALLASLAFTFAYATLAAKSRRAEMVLIPLLDVLQSIPVLGYLSFTVVFFVWLFPGRILGLELAAIFAIFTSQAWNMMFSFFQALRTIPHDLDEASRSFRFSAWQRFWRLRVHRLRFQVELEDHLTRREAERTLKTVTGWARYAELVDYSDKSHIFAMTASAA
jgi:NitT/TauT family transport system permease protein